MQMEKEMDDVILRAAAKHLGKKGGAIGSVKQREARRKNSLKGGRKRKYVYDMKVQAILGKKTEKMCLIPDEIVIDPGKFQNKTFAVYSEGRRFNARVWAYRADKTNIRVCRV